MSSVRHTAAHEGEPRRRNHSCIGWAAITSISAKNAGPRMLADAFIPAITTTPPRTLRPVSTRTFVVAGG